MEKYIPKFCHVHDLYRSGQVTRLISSSTADAVVPAFSFIDAVEPAFTFYSPPTGRPREHHKTNKISMFPGVRTQTQTKMFSVFYEMRLSTTAASGLSAACSTSMHTWCGNRESSVADSSTCLRYDEVATRRGAQCRSCGYIGDCCQQVRDVGYSGV